MRVLVTGATGFIGSQLVRQLLDEGVDVRIFRRPTSSFDLLGEAANEVEHAVGSLADPSSIRKAVEGVTHIYHAAAMVSFAPRHRKRLHQINVKGVAHIVNASIEAGVERLVYTSSMAAFGRPEVPRGIIDETAEWRDSAANTEYGYTKHLGELEVHRGIAEGLDAVIVNPALVFGPGRARQNTRAIVDIVRKRRLPVMPAGATNVVDVRDVAAGHRRAMQHGRTGERYFLGSENLSWREIIETVAGAFGVKPPKYTAAPKLAEGLAWTAEKIAHLTRLNMFITRETVRTASRHYQYDNSKAVGELGCSFRPFAETMAHMAAVMQEDRESH